MICEIESLMLIFTH